MARNSVAEAVEPVLLNRPRGPIDLVHLAKQCMGDEQLEQEILRLFDTTMQVYFARLSAATAPEDIRLNLHSIKGASAGVGAFTITDVAKAAEMNFLAGKPLSPEVLADLGVAIEEVRGFIAGLLT